MTGHDEGWAVGQAGLIWHDVAGTWNAISSPVTIDLNTVKMDLPTHGWAGGGTSNGTFTPVLLEYTGTTWIDRSSTLPNGAPVIQGMAFAPGGTEGWAVGYKDFNNPSSTSSCATAAGRGHSITEVARSPSSKWPWTPTTSGGYRRRDCGRRHWGRCLQIHGWSVAPVLHSYRVVLPGGLSLVPGWEDGRLASLGNIMRYTSPFLPTPTATSVATSTPTETETSVATSTSTSTEVPSVTATPCTITFTDVSPSDYFYVPVQYLYCHGVISGYGDNTFWPSNSTTRGQLSKIVVLALGWDIYIPTTPTFTDVPTDHPFYQYIETAYSHGVISGYGDGTFRPGNDVTRGQLCKIVVNAMGWAIYTPPTPTFTDVPTDHPFYQYIETAYAHGIISGYGTVFLPGNSATRGQISKIVYNAVTNP